MFKYQSSHRARCFPVLAAAFIGTCVCFTGCSDPGALEDPETNHTTAPSVALQTAIIEGDDQAVYEHILAGNSVNTRSAMGDTPLHIAAAMGRSYATEVLIGAGADLEAVNNSGATPLFNAAFFCHKDVLKKLIDAGGSTNITDANGTTIQQIMSTPWEQMFPIYEMVHRSIGLPFDKSRIESARAEIAEMLR